MNAAERFVAASASRDVESAVEALAPDVVMVNPATDDRVVGRDAVADALRAVETACDEFRHSRLLADTAATPPRVFALVFEARVGDEALTGIDLVEVDERDLIGSFTVFARPLSALMALGSRMQSQP